MHLKRQMAQNSYIEALTLNTSTCDSVWRKGLYFSFSFFWGGKGTLKWWLTCHEDVRLSPDPTWLLSKRKHEHTEEPRAHVHRGMTTRGQSSKEVYKPASLQAKEESQTDPSFAALRENQPCQHLNPGLRSSLWTVRKVNFCCLSHQSVVCCYGSPSKQIHDVFIMFKDLKL